MENVKVSIVVAVYNVEPYLEKCVKSICYQTWENLEIILIDDGSTDESGRLCDELAQRDERISVIHQRNSGVSEARNTGIQKAIGKYIAFVDSDDYLEPEYVEKLLEQTDLNSIAIVGYYVDIEVPGRMHRRTVTAGKNPIVYLDTRQAVTVYKLELFNVVWNKLYETDVLKRGILFESEYSLGEDLLFNLKYLSERDREYRIINQPLYHYMKRGLQSMDTKYRVDFFDIQKKIFTDFIKYLVKIKANKKDMEILYEYFFHSLIVALDNLYRNRNQIEKKQYQVQFQNLTRDKEFDLVLRQLHGWKQAICSLRLWGIRHRLYRIDYAARECIKRILKMK